jgi:heavy metal sensor kinase
MLSKLWRNFMGRFDVRLTAYYTIALLLLSIAIALFLYYRLEHNITKQVDRILLDEFHELTLEIEEDGGIREGAAGFAEDVVQRKYYPILFQVLTPEGELVAQSEGAAGFFTFGSRNEPHFTVSAGSDEEGGQRHYRVLEQRFREEGIDREYLAQVATPLKYADKILENYLENIVSAIPGIFSASILIGFLIAKGPRDILKEIIGVSRRITSENLSQRLVLPGARDEIRELCVTINSMLERIEGAFGEIRQFTGDVSHELRTPLSAIRGEIEVALTHGGTVADCQEVLANCLERVDEVIRMVNDLIMISRFDENEINCHPTKIDATELAGEIIDFLMPLAQEKKIRLQMTTSEPAIFVADRGSIVRLLNNLVDNALKFAPEGGTVSVSARRTDRTLELRVADNGPGVPPSERTNIFRRFYQVNPARSGAERGTGLGLHICQRIAEFHGGTIRLEDSSPAGGAVFVATFPLA